MGLFHEQKYISIQNELAKKIILENTIQETDIKHIAGVDLAYWDDCGINRAVCCVVVMDRQTKSIIEVKHYIDEVTVPYAARFLSFRELPLVIKTFEVLQNDPDIIMFDGNGVLHYRKMGIATHASFYLNKPTIGIAKSYFKVANTDYIMPDAIEGAKTDIVIKDEVLGCALRTRTNVKPIFVSCGNWISLDTATKLVMEFATDDSRLPMPVRIADMETRKLRKQILSG